MLHWVSHFFLLGLFVLATALAAEPVAESPPAQPDEGMRMVGSLRLHPVPESGGLPSFLLGDQLSRDAQGTIILQGNAQVRRLDSVIKGDRIEFDQDTGQAVVRGNGLLMRDGSIVRGPHLRFNVDTDQGTIDQPRFWLGGTAGSGHADEAEIFSREHARLRNVYYSGCPCPDPAWHIETARMDLYPDENEGVARHGVLYFKGVPLLYSPYLTFPLRQERKSGFLLPTYGSSSHGGFELTTPYYLNLAPNYDATLYPRFMSKRGLLMGAEFRHLGRESETTLFGTYNVRDRVSGHKRWLYSAQYSDRLRPGLQLYLDARRVSDDDYFRDHASFGLADASVTYMPSQALLTWDPNRYFNAYLQFYRYQTLQDDTGSFLVPPYNKLPELGFTAHRYGWKGFDLYSRNTYTRFNSPVYRGDAFPEMKGLRLLPNGTRLSSYTTIARPFVAPGAYLTPKFGLHLSQYTTDWFRDLGLDEHGRPYSERARSQTRVVPISSLDAGLTFERPASLFGNPAIHTLEPRLYYLYVPYRNQSHLPVYDTGVATFNYVQAFDENIFSGGWDRISNANQLTVGLTSRWLDAGTGFERVSLSAAQRFYFTDQRVTLPSQLARRDMESDYLVSGSAALTDRFSVYFDGQFDYKTIRRERLSAGVRWAPKRLAIASLSYRYERDPNMYTDPYRRLSSDTVLQSREQISLAGQWPLSQRWYGVGRFDYSMAEKRNTQAILGLEYRGDGGWAGRVVFQRYAVSSRKANTAVFFQLELVGLGSLGSESMSMLADRITGYQPVTPPIPEKTIFERYE